MLKQTFPCHEGHEQLGITHLLHITLVDKLLDEIIQFNGATNPPNTTKAFWWLRKSPPCPIVVVG